MDTADNKVQLQIIGLLTLPIRLVSAWLLLAATCLVFLALGEAVLTGRLARTNRAALALRFDWHARWIYPALVIVLSVAIVAT